MPIVFDQVDGVVQRAPEPEPETASAATVAPPDPRDAERLALGLERLERRVERLRAD
jgi:hypothetical protein